MATVINVKPLINLTSEAFYQLCLSNPDITMEKSPQGDLIIMSPVGGESGNREANLTIKLGIWNLQYKLGQVFSSSTIFKLPNGGDRSPDVAWVSQEKWDSLTPEEKRKFPPLCPDFVIELRSESDRLKPLQEKMQEYLNSGLRLGWLINPQDGEVEVYRPEKSVEVLKMPCLLSGEDVLPNFELQMDINC
ncbi:Uma2 family endonuclease [Cyanobacterium sp. Dongsha4]|uniref:Uma2 family endonuclease n=1 Tax=Cyanobacterium sp. DS4 TaxID=2878255 RepID=UPI002E8070CC|nr:Uma2 family endonuclease [Cyanobacterium sp. Dongsha4]WVL02240.1 Uma2 family endonuclease [Cyanobacterium sp. Dongsha4]